MGDRCTASLLLAVVLISSGCGFKSDLYLPDQSENAGQQDPNSVETLDTLQEESSDGVEFQIRGAIENLPSVDSVPVVVDPLTEDEIEEIKKNRDENKLP